MRLAKVNFKQVPSVPIRKMCSDDDEVLMQQNYVLHARPILSSPFLHAGPGGGGMGMFCKSIGGVRQAHALGRK